MKLYWLNKNEHTKLILFFGGWGTDYHPFLPIKSETYDVVMFYDYKTIQLPDDFEQLLITYSEVIVIGWSLGTWVANYLCQTHKAYINKGIAINGTLNPISDDEGIPLAVFEGTLKNISALNLVRFNRRMLQLPQERKLFESNIPQRTWNDLRDELVHLREVIVPSRNEIYDYALVGIKDYIFPTLNQANSWKNKVNIFEMEVSHFPFYQFNSWDEIITTLTATND